MKTLLVIAAHGDADDTVDRHYPFWERSGCDILITSSVNNPSKRAALRIGQSGWAGSGAIERFLLVWKELVKLPYDAFCLGEYDAVTFRPIPDHPMDGVIYGPLWKNYDPEFKASEFMHPFYWMAKETLQRILDESVLLLYAAEKGYGDRWLAHLWECAGIPFANNPLNFSRQTIGDESGYQCAESALRNGAWGIHGIKSEECLNRLAQVPL